MEDKFDYQTAQQPMYYQSEYYPNDFQITSPLQQQENQPLVSSTPVQTSENLSIISILKPATKKRQQSNIILQVFHLVVSILLCIGLVVLAILIAIAIVGIILAIRVYLMFLIIPAFLFYIIIIGLLFTVVMCFLTVVVQLIACCTIVKTTNPEKAHTLQQNLKTSVPHIMAKGQIIQPLYRAEQTLYMEEVIFQIQPYAQMDHTNGVDKLLDKQSTMFSSIRIVQKMQLDELSEKWIKDEVEALKTRCKLPNMMDSVTVLKRFTNGENQFTSASNSKIIEQQNYRNMFVEGLLKMLCCVGLVIMANWIKAINTTFLELEMIVPVRVIGVEKQVRLNLIGTTPNTNAVANTSTMATNSSAISSLSLEQYVKNCCTKLMTEQQMSVEMAQELEKTTLQQFYNAFISSMPMLLAATPEQFERIQLPIPMDYLLKNELPNLHKK